MPKQAGQQADPLNDFNRFAEQPMPAAKAPKWKQILCVAMAAVCAPLCSAQAVSASMGYGLEQGETPPLQVIVQYDGTHANAPPGQCGCFWLQGAGAQVQFAVSPRFSAVGDLYDARASNISGTGENLRLFNYVFGPRYSLRNTTRYTPYAQVLAGGDSLSSNYGPYAAGKTYLAAQAGVGVSVWMSRRYSIIPLEANWVFSKATNDVNDRQNNFRFGAGVAIHFGR